MRIKQAAQALGVSTFTLERLEHVGKITVQRDWAGHRRFTEADVARLRAALWAGR